MESGLGKVFGIVEAIPLKQGLKQPPPNPPLGGGRIVEAIPLKQGLKQGKTQTKGQ